MALSRLDFIMIIDAVEGKIAHIEETSTSDTIEEEIKVWNVFRNKMVRMMNNAEARIAEIQDELNVNRQETIDMG
jgi:hypothetical protein